MTLCFDLKIDKTGVPQCHTDLLIMFIPFSDYTEEAGINKEAFYLA